MPETDLDIDEAIIFTNWKTLVSCQQKNEKLLHDIVTKETEEAKKSLRWILEAQKGTAINQYLFVFTVTTIIHLPLSFVASTFGMHLFDSSEPHKT
ncbi:uncharacterized protein BDZ99DRAFT_515613 [Mytilinidion resinicola]|uniref:Uncharacterized protein n=1 Tax=Mytilinidion resinicola TaxID=574789 RepID=A0A6A6Z2E2_9PEZI|nr:uncharacterized protein BDZ99DRAFT_515613 [Mytilinidion resinicola]KAF2814843.1 hypothetical protein BDZ99DRAFT_515613 [Mytilinidion resinicola]